MRAYLAALAFSLAVWIALGVIFGWVWAFVTYVTLAVAMEARRRWRIRQLKKHPLYYLIAIQQEFGERK